MLNDVIIRGMKSKKQNALTNLDDRLYGSEFQDHEHDGSDSIFYSFEGISRPSPILPVFEDSQPSIIMSIDDHYPPSVSISFISQLMTNKVDCEFQRLANALAASTALLPRSNSDHFSVSCRELMSMHSDNFKSRHLCKRFQHLGIWGRYTAKALPYKRCAKGPPDEPKPGAEALARCHRLLTIFLSHPIISCDNPVPIALSDLKRCYTELLADWDS